MQSGKKGTMDLFTLPADKHMNWLPYGGTVNYFGKVLSSAEADHYQTLLLKNIEWRNDELVMFGKRIVTKRKVAWYADRPYPYTYSRQTKVALLFTPELLQLKSLIEEQTGDTYNSCLLNLYHSGEEGMSWHSDAEPELKKEGAIASMSLGAERMFAFRHKDTKETVSLLLEHGSLLLMKGSTQTNWLHRLPPSKRSMTPRVNLTFRTIVGGE